MLENALLEAVGNLDVLRPCLQATQATQPAREGSEQRLTAEADMKLANIRQLAYLDAWSHA